MSEFDLGESEHDFRVPDGGPQRPGAGDESWQKLPFYAAHDVDEVLVVDPIDRTVGWLALRGCEYLPPAAVRLVTAS